MLIDAKPDFENKIVEDNIIKLDEAIWVLINASDEAIYGARVMSCGCEIDGHQAIVESMRRLFNLEFSLRANQAEDFVFDCMLNGRIRP